MSWEQSAGRFAYDQRADDKRVVITGMGAVTPLGLDVASTWQALLAGQSGVVSIRDQFLAQGLEAAQIEGFRSQVAGLVKGFLIDPFMSAKDARRYDTFIHYAVASAAMALQDAGLIADFTAPISGVDPYRCGVLIGSGIGGVQTIEESSLTLHQKGAKRVSPFVIPSSIVNMPAGLVAIKHQLKGANLATATACTTATHAIGLAARLIAYGDADLMLAGGSEKASSPLAMAGFASMHALSTRNDEPTRASRPFDKDRDGFVLGDGAGVLVLESLAHAKARGAKILAELVGFGMSDDASHITAPAQEGEGAYRAMQNALRDAQIPTEVIGYINAHGTSTPAGDIAESQAIEKLFATTKDTLLVSSTKSMTGHLLGAAGAVEAIFTVLALQNQIIPPTINLDHPDEQCRLDYVAHQARPVQNLNYAISNSFGFGGTNGSLAFARWMD